MTVNLSNITSYPRPLGILLCSGFNVIIMDEILLSKHCFLYAYHLWCYDLTCYILYFCLSLNK